jgi:steroid 5-alpha reductase family enzyme
MMPEWTEFWRLMVFALAIPVVMMAGVWVMARLLNNAGIVDIFWSYGFIPVALACAVLGGGDVTRSFVLVLMVTIWAARLGTYLLIRVAKHHPEEDGRYAALRQQFRNHTWAMFLGFFEAQGVYLKAALDAAPADIEVNKQCARYAGDQPPGVHTAYELSTAVPTDRRRHSMRRCRHQC